jgi:hypothetical protein
MGGVASALRGVAKLKIELRSDRVLDGCSKALATAHVKGRNRWQKVVTPSGIEPVFRGFAMTKRGADLGVYMTIITH